MISSMPATLTYETLLKICKITIKLLFSSTGIQQRIKVYCCTRLSITHNFLLYYLFYTGPLKNTVVDFWRLIWQEAPQYIVMVTKLKESSATKCERYWPMENTSQMYGPFKVTTLSKAILPDITRRQLKVEVRKVFSYLL